jgi:PAS domain S-box-containing protein
MRARWACACLLALLGAVARASAAENPAAGPEEGGGRDPAPRALRVGVYEFEPLVSVRGQGGPGGLYVDLLEHVARQEGWRLVYVPGTWDDCLRALLDGEVDLVPVVGYSEERARRFAFTAESPVLDWGVVFTREGSPIESLFDLQGKRIGALRGSIYTRNFRAMLEQFGIEAHVVEEGDYRAAFGALRRGDVDAAINAQVAGAALASEYHLEPTQIVFSPVKLAYAAPPGRADVLRTLDRHFAALKADPRSIWYDLLARWMPGRPARVPGWVLPLLASGTLLLLATVAFAWLMRRQATRSSAALITTGATLRETEEMLRTISDAIPDPLFVKDRASRWLFANPGALAAIGKESEQVLGKSDAEIYDDRAIAERLIATDRRVMESGRAEVVEETVQTPGGHRVFLSTKVPYRGADGTVVGIIGSARDITDRVRAEQVLRDTEEQLRQAQKLESIGRLAGGIAHDFNNLLTVILSCAAGLEEGLRDGTPAAEDVEHIREAATRASELTRQLLAFARKQVIAPVPLDLNSVVRGSEKLLRRVIGEDVALAVSLEEPLWSARCDRGQIEQVIMNLVVNARDAMPRGGRLAIETANERLDGARGRLDPDAPPGEYVRLVIRDSGTGMTPDVQAHLFEPFFTTKGHGKGTGLGLATVYGVVKQSGGYVHVDTAPGRGTSVAIWLPREARAPVAPEAPRPPPGQRGTETVLVVEDDRLVREVTVRALRSAGYEVLVAASAEEALALQDEQLRRVGLLVTDVVMPGLDGRALATELARRRPELRVLYVSGYTHDVIAERGVLDSGLEYLPKPFTAPVLLAKVRTVLDAPAARAS